MLYPVFVCLSVCLLETTLLDRQLGMTCLINCVTFLFLGLFLEVVLKLIFSPTTSAPSALEVFHYNALCKFMFTITIKFYEVILIWAPVSRLQIQTESALTEFCALPVLLTISLLYGCTIKTNFLTKFGCSVKCFAQYYYWNFSEKFFGHILPDV